MKMRASFGKVVVCALAGFCIFALALSFAIREDQAAPGRSVAQDQAMNAKKFASPVSDSEKAKWIDSYGKLPMAFEGNRGQTDSRVQFLSRGKGYQLFLTPQEAVLAMRDAKSPSSTRAAALEDHRKATEKIHVSVVRIRLVGASSDVKIAGQDRLPGNTNYFVGDDQRDWRTDIPSYRRVQYTAIYPGIDLDFYGNQQRLEYDYVVAPGADPNAIALDVKGAKKIAVDSEGNLVLSVPGGDIDLQKPVVYQDVNGRRRLVAANYAVSADQRVGFALGPYDTTKALTIDPILNYSTYLGGSASGDTAYGVGVDSLGDAYVAGQTFSLTFPTTSANAYDSAPPSGTAGSGAVFVTELDPTGATQLYSSYLGGNGGELAYGIAVDSSGLAYVTGQTFSTNFPVVNAFQAPPASNANGTAFLSKINTTLSGVASLVYSTYLGGSGGDLARAIAVDSSQNAYLCGLTFSSDFPVSASPLQSTPSNPNGTAFLSRIDTTQSGAASLIYSTYLGGNGTNAGSIGFGDWAFGIAADSSSNAYLVGITTSTNFPVLNAYQSNAAAANSAGTTFMTRIDTTKSGAASLIYSTYLSGSVSDFGFGIALGPNNVAYLTGQTYSADFPVTSGAFTTSSAQGLVFVSLVDTSKSGANSLPYSTLFGGNNGDEGLSIQADSVGNAYFTGSTASIGPVAATTTFPVTAGALQTTSANTQGVAFVTEINPGGVNTGAPCTGSACLIYSTLFGGNGNGVLPDRAYGIALDASNTAYIVGQTSSTDFPVFPNPGAFQTSLTQTDAASTESAFASKLTLQPTVTISPLAINFGTVFITSNATQPVTITNNTGLAGIPLTILSMTGTNAADFTATPGGASPCGATLATNNTPCTVNVTFTPTVNGNESATLPLQYSPYGIVNTQSIMLTGAGSNVAVGVTPTSLTFAGQLVSTTSPAQTVTVSNNGATSLAYTETLTDPTGSYAAALSSGSPCTGGTIPANTSCTINVTFTPTSANANPVTATLALSAGGLNQNVSLSGTAWDFQLTPPSQSVSAAPGAAPSPAPQVTVTLLGGFAGPVTLSCSGSIPMGSCSVPGSVTATGPVTVTLSTAGSSAAPPVKWHVPPVSPWQKLFIGLAILSLLAVPFARQRRQKISLAGALVLMIALTACSGSAGTPAGTYNLTITGSSGGRTQTATIAFTVT
jgi:hypothetical protein